MKIFLVLALSLLLTACGANSEFTKHYGPESSIEGGPVMEMVDDVEIWTHGKPQKDHVVIGEVEDVRKSGLIYMVGIDGDIASSVKQKGGDGAYRTAYGLVPSGMTNPSITMGATSGGTPYSYANPSVVKYARSSKYKIFKYKD